MGCFSSLFLIRLRVMIVSRFMVLVWGSNFVLSGCFFLKWSWTAGSRWSWIGPQDGPWPNKIVTGSRQSLLDEVRTLSTQEYRMDDSKRKEYGMDSSILKGIFLEHGTMEGAHIHVLLIYTYATLAISTSKRLGWLITIAASLIDKYTKRIMLF